MCVCIRVEAHERAANTAPSKGVGEVFYVLLKSHERKLLLIIVVKFLPIHPSLFAQKLSSVHNGSRKCL